jgi:pimeloyl-ACP methyl ester carboxylesterase
MIMIDFTHGVDNLEVFIPPLRLPALFTLPRSACGIVAFAHGSGSGRFSPRNMAVAAALNARGFGTLLLDLLTEAETADRASVFNISLLANRLSTAIDWILDSAELRRLPLGLFGASTGAAAALVAAARYGDVIRAVVSRGGRPDLARGILATVTAPTLLIVGGADTEVLAMNREAYDLIRGPKALEIVAGASHLFPEPGALERVTEYAGLWYQRYLVHSDARD